jgi:hypothetical protein
MQCLYAQNLFGQSYAQAGKSDFVNFFRFKEEGQKELPNKYKIVSLSTQLAGNVVSLGIMLNNEMTVGGMTLRVPRKLIDDPKFTLHARDLCKSFLDTAVPQESLQEFQTLKNEIQFSVPNLKVIAAPKLSAEDSASIPKKIMKIGNGPIKPGDTILPLNGELPKLPSMPTDDYLIFTGKPGSIRKNLNTAIFEIKNNKENNGDYLIMSVVH